MPITISLLPNNVDSSASNFVYAIATLTFSGSYPTGGDTLDFTTVADRLPSTQIIQAFAESQNGFRSYHRGRSATRQPDFLPPSRALAVARAGDVAHALRKTVLGMFDHRHESVR